MRIFFCENQYTNAITLLYISFLAIPCVYLVSTIRKLNRTSIQSTVVCTFQHSDNRLSDINFGVNKMLNPISFSVKLSYPQQEVISIHT